MLACVAAALLGPRGGGRIPVEIASTRPGRVRDRWAWPAVGLAHVASTLWLFAGVLAGRLVFFRDLSTYYAPQYAFAARALREGTWPLWNPLANAGEPFLLVYPVDLVLLLVGGGDAPLGWGVAGHLLLALVGGSLLARSLGVGPLAAWLAGTVYGLGGLCLSVVNLMPLFQAVAWAPLVVQAFVAVAERADGRRLAILAVLLAVQTSTLGVEIVVQTVLVALVLVSSRPFWRDRDRLARIAMAAVLALLLAAPAILGVRWLVEGTARQHGFSVEDALSDSVHPLVLGEVLLPGFLGDPHAFTDRDYWGRALFPTGFPYFVSLYLGLPVLLVGTAGRTRRRLWLVAALGVVLALGRFGPLGLLPGDLTLPVRGPQKLFFMTHLSLALLAGLGLEGALGLGRCSLRRAVGLVAPGVALFLAGVGAALAPTLVRDLLAHMAPPLLDPRGLVAVSKHWPLLWMSSGALALGAGLSLARGGRAPALAAVAVVVDLLAVNGAVNPLAPATFYELRGDVAALLRPAAEAGWYRWFSYGVAHTPGLRFEPVMARAPSDVWLYYLDRQSLLPRAHALDGLEGAFDIDRTGWSPAGATLPLEEARPDRFREHHGRLRGANVRWVLSFQPLPADLAAERGRVKLSEVGPPLKLYEVLDPLPRVFWVAGPGRSPASPRGAVELTYEPVDAHTVRVTAETPPGRIVVLDGHHPYWTAENRSGPVAVARVGDRWRGVATPGGRQVFTFRYRPPWRLPAFVLAGLGLLGVLVLGRR